MATEAATRTAIREENIFVESVVDERLLVGFVTCWDPEDCLLIAIGFYMFSVHAFYRRIMFPKIAKPCKNIEASFGGASQFS